AVRGGAGRAAGRAVSGRAELLSPARLGRDGWQLGDGRPPALPALRGVSLTPPAEGELSLKAVWRQAQAEGTTMAATETSFYVTGGTLRLDAPCYVERRADRELHEALVRGDFCYVLTSRQMGKSSLMVHTAARLRAEGVQVAILDLTAIGQNLSAEQWYGGL